MINNNKCAMNTIVDIVFNVKSRGNLHATTFYWN